jgi:hypothetical protein
VVTKVRSDGVSITESGRPIVGPSSIQPRTTLVEAARLEGATLLTVTRLGRQREADFDTAFEAPSRMVRS